ncbi:MAG TPA: hypothetical protein VF725_08485, partial [Ktedonobacterales bacterium]
MPESAIQNTLDNITTTLLELLAQPSVSGQEEQARDYVWGRLTLLDLDPQTDAAGNLIARVAAHPASRDGEPPILLNAHLDRVPPG